MLRQYSRIAFAAAFFAAVLSGTAKNAFSGDIDLEKWLPQSTVAYLHVESLETILEHPFSTSLRTSSAFKTLMRSPEAIKARAGLALLEFAIGDKLESIVKKLTTNGACIAIDKETQGVVLLADSESAEWLDDYLQRLVKMARTDAKSKQQPDPIREADYRGLRGYEFQKTVVTNIGSVLLVTNQPRLAKDIIDRSMDATKDHLVANPLFQQATQSRSAESAQDALRIANGFVDLDTLREAGVAKELLGSNRKDFAGELLLGGVLAVLQKTSFTSGAIAISPNNIRIQLQVPYDQEWIQESHTFFVGPNSKGFAPAAPNTPSSLAMLASVRSYRDLSEMWRRAGDLFDEKVNDQLAQADNTLTTLFSGKDFGTDILGAIEPQVQLMASEQKYELGATPAIKLPSFGIVAKLRDADMKKELKRTFQSFIGFLNVVGAMEGNPQLDLDAESIEGVQYYSATYLRDRDKKYDAGLPVQFNFSPTLAFKGDFAYVSSTLAFAKKMASLPLVNTNAAPELSNAPPELDNTVASINVDSLRHVLESNLQQLISQNMLDKGHSKTEAENEIDILMKLLSLLQTGKLALRFDDSVRLQLDVTMQFER